MNKRIRILYLDDVKVVKQGVNFLLLQHKQDFEVIEADIQPAEVTEYLQKNRVDVIIVDLQLSFRGDATQLNGFDVCALVKAKFPYVKMVAHSIYDSIEHVNKFLDNGGMGFVSKRSGHEELIDAVKEVYAGNFYICSEIRKQAKNTSRFIAGQDQRLKATSEFFTKAEKSVLERIARGYSTKQIAHQLEVSEKTVETHRKHLFDKAKVKNVAELMAFAYSRRMFME